MTHFKFEIVPAGKWERMTDTDSKKGSDEPRPHFVAITEAGRNFVRLDACGAKRLTVLCPGYVLEGDQRIEAYRFIETPEGVDARLDSLNREVDLCSK